jgi:hypothetical protein
VRWAKAQAAEPHSRTRRRLAAILIGALIGYAIGGAFVLAFDRARYSGDSSSLSSFAMKLLPAGRVFPVASNLASSRS